MKEIDKIKLKINFGKKEHITDWFIYDTGIFREALDNSIRRPYFENDVLALVDEDGKYLIKKMLMNIVEWVIKKKWNILI